MFGASLVLNGNSGAHLNGSTSVEFVQGQASLNDISVDTAGSGYQLTLNTYTVPSSRYACCAFAPYLFSSYQLNTHSVLSL